MIESVTYTNEPIDCPIPMNAPNRLVLPDAPRELRGAVKAWRQPVRIATYLPHPADRNPIFLESRVYQGSSGKVYPLPFVERIEPRSIAQTWDALHIENEFLRVMILPGLGGRIHVGLDKTNGYDFFYRQNVIKPALVGLAGPWASGGVEFNWPQHHRPATYMPVEATIEEHPDGSITIWCSDHDPFERLKGAHGVCLHPGKSLLELKVRLYNRTPLTQTFLWWANAAARVHEHYQSFFPPDVRYVADHARRAMSTYPLCEGTYYGVDYARRAKEGIPPEEMPSQFLPPGSYAPNDLRWYANIPVPTSYMALGSRADFFGGYDHRVHAGVMHVSNHHISPGKKQWTWGNHEFGYSWDLLLTDDDGPYIELMAGVFTDNQPDFSFLAPGETKSFSQYWYPIRELGAAQAANIHGACFVEKNAAGGLSIALNTTEAMRNVRVALSSSDGSLLAEHLIERIDPASPARIELPVALLENYSLRFEDSSRHEFLRYEAIEDSNLWMPSPAQEPPLPHAVESLEELVIVGRHLEQYRHATRDPAPYWREGLRRDPGESRCHEALGLWHLRRGEFTFAEDHFSASAARLTLLNANPPDGCALYHLGLVRRYLGKDDEAYDALYKATWNFAWRSAAHHLLAEMDAVRGRFQAAIGHLEQSIRANPENLRARNLLTVLLRQTRQDQQASQLLAESLAIDPTDVWTRFLHDGSLPRENQMLLDMSFDYARAGFFPGALSILQQANRSAADGSVPIVRYAEACFLHRSGQPFEAKLQEARAALPDYCFPNRLEEMQLLLWAIAHHPADARARYYLGNLLYDKRRYEDAIEQWEAAATGEGAVPTVWRNLGIAFYNVRGDAKRAQASYQRAFEMDPGDARVFFERDQLWKRIGVTPEDRLREYARLAPLVAQRDDLSIEQIALFNQTGRHQEALSSLEARSFQPWEGGEGLVREQHVRTHLALGRVALIAGEAKAAHDHFLAALESPPHLGEAAHLLVNRANIYFWLGETSPHEEARLWRRKAVASDGDFQQMSVQTFSAMTFYRLLALHRLGRTDEAHALQEKFCDYIDSLERTAPKIDYFATSLPNTLLFREDLQRAQDLFVSFLRAQLLLASGDPAAAECVLNRIHALDPNYGAAADLRQEATCLQALGALSR